MDGIKYYRLDPKPNYYPDVTKFASLTCKEVDENFHTLRGNDIEGMLIETKDGHEYLVLKRVNGKPEDELRVPIASEQKVMELEAELARTNQRIDELIRCIGDLIDVNSTTLNGKIKDVVLQLLRDQEEETELHNLDKNDRPVVIDWDSTPEEIHEDIAKVTRVVIKFAPDAGFIADIPTDVDGDCGCHNNG